jgi:hypothetical protein
VIGAILEDDSLKPREVFRRCAGIHREMFGVSLSDTHQEGNPPARNRSTQPPVFGKEIAYSSRGFIAFRGAGLRKSFLLVEFFFV